MRAKVLLCVILIFVTTSLSGCDFLKDMLNSDNNESKKELKTVQVIMYYPDGSTEEVSVEYDIIRTIYSRSTTYYNYELYNDVVLVVSDSYIMFKNTNTRFIGTIKIIDEGEN